MLQRWFTNRNHFDSISDQQKGEKKMNKTSKHTHREKPRIKQFIDIRGLMEVLATSVEYAELLNLQHRYNMCFSLSVQVVHVYVGKGKVSSNTNL